MYNVVFIGLAPDLIEHMILKMVHAQCVQLMLARSPMVTMYCHLATYFSFLSAILGDKAGSDVRHMACMT